MQVFLHRGRNLMLRIGIAKMSHRYHEKNFRFNPAFFEIPDGSWIEGYWQSEKYFQVIEQEIRKEFRINSTPDGTNLSILEKMKSVAAVSLHIRRGDFVSDKVTNELHGVCSLSYYEQAIAHIRNHVSDPHFFIFSDDMEWVRENLPVQDLRVDYMDHNGPKDYEDLRLMYSCRHHITANSSFSWWGAWLNDSKDKIVVCPEDWTKGPYQNPDIFPDGWIRLKG